jgi:tetratricopeptide (TPR) repeat protein
MAAPEYRNFIVRAGPASANNLRVEVAGIAPGGLPRQNEHEIVPFDPSDCKLFRTRIDERDIDLLEAVKRRPVPEAALYATGKVLAGLILPGKVRERFRATLEHLVSHGERMRLRLVLDEPTLKVLPWEFLYLPDDLTSPDDWSGFLALNQNVSIVRHEAIDSPEPAKPRGGKYRMVAALASPDGQDPLDISADQRAIQSAIANVKGIGSITPSWINPATRSELEQALALKEGCDIFHFSGHALFFDGKGQIILQRPDDKRGDPYDAGDLSHLLRDARAKIAILSGCETGQRSAETPWGGVAASLVGAGLAAVVASQYRLLDKSARALAETLYPPLLSGKTIDEGIYEARKRMRLEYGLKGRDWASLVLYLRPEDGVIFRDSPDDKRERGPRIAPTPLQIPLVGRDDQLADMRAQLGSGHNIFVFGSYGVGKTSLAVKLFDDTKSEQRFARGHIWGRLPANASPERALEWLAGHFGVQDVAQANNLAEKVSAMRRLLAGSAGVLIGLDDVRSPAVARAILEASGPSGVMINSDLQIDVGGMARDVKLEPLLSEQAEALFMALAKIDPADPQRGLVAQICNRMGRLPLGIKLAALKCAEGESLATLWTRLQYGAVADENARLLFATSFKDVQASPQAERLLVRIASFPALEAPLEPLREDEPDAEFFQAKDKLIALGLIGAAGPDRLAQHPVLAPLSLEQADKSLVTREKKWVGEWLANYAAAHRDDFAALHREHDNLLGLLDRRIDARSWNGVVELMRHLFDYLRLRGLWRELVERLDKCLDPKGKSGSRLTKPNRGWAYVQRAIIRTLMSQFDEALSDLTNAEACYNAKTDGTELGRIRYRRGVVFLQRRSLQAAAEEFTAALAGMDAAAAPADVAGAHARLGAVLAQQASLDLAKAEFASALAMAEKHANGEEEARVHIALGNLDERQGNRSAAAAHFQQALRLATGLDDRLQAAQIIRQLGDQHYHSGRYSESRERFLEAQQIFQALGFQPGLARCLHALGNVALAEGDEDAARRNYQQALSLNNSLGLRGSASYNQYQLAVLDHRGGKFAGADRGYQDALLGARAVTDRVLEAATLAQLTKLRRNQKRWEEARTCGQEALRLAEQLKDKLTQAVALYHLAMVDAADGQLTEAKGRLMEAREAFAAFDAPELAMIKHAVEDLAAEGSVAQRETSGVADHEPPRLSCAGPDRTPSGPPEAGVTDQLAPAPSDPDPPCSPDPGQWGRDPERLFGPDRILGDIAPMRQDDRETLFGPDRILEDVRPIESDDREIQSDSDRVVSDKLGPGDGSDELWGGGAFSDVSGPDRILDDECDETDDDHGDSGVL